MQLTQDELRKAQLLMLKILKEVHRICEENNIKYFLSDGTLIGAVRHNGFIPWDDDLDIGMLREEYEKFCKIAPEKLGEEFVLQTTETDPGYGLQFGKVMLKGTVWLEHHAKKTNRNFSGIYIDIFPYDKIPKLKAKQKKLYKKYKFINALIAIKLKYSSLRNISTLLKKCYYIIKVFVSKFISLRRLLLARDLLCKKFINEDDVLITKYGGSFIRNQNTIAAYSNYELHKFEDSEFYIPKQFDDILNNLYGTYMDLPPVEARINHGIFEYDFGEYN